MADAVADVVIRPDPAAHHQIVEGVLARFRGRVPDHYLEELRQAGMIRLYREAERFDGRGAFVGYAVQRVGWAMQDELRRLSPTRRSRGLREDFARQQFWQQQRAEADAGVAGRERNEAEPVLLSLEALRDTADAGDAGDDRPRALDAFLADDTEDIEERTATNDLAHRLWRVAVSVLEEKELLVFRLLVLEEHTLVEVGRQVGLSASRVQQIQVAALKAVRFAALQEGLR